MGAGLHREIGQSFRGGEAGQPRGDVVVQVTMVVVEVVQRPSQLPDGRVPARLLGRGLGGQNAVVVGVDPHHRRRVVGQHAGDAAGGGRADVDRWVLLVEQPAAAVGGVQVV